MTFPLVRIAQDTIHPATRLVRIAQDTIHPASPLVRIAQDTIHPASPLVRIAQDDLHPASCISVVICAYTEARWRDLVAAVASVHACTVQPCEIVVVIDHNPSLLERARNDIQGVIVVENRERKGLSGARNTGAAVAHGAVVAFLDDDAIAEPDWVARLAMCYADPRVAGVGGRIEPLWLEARPSWFPAEFNWAVGCTYRGMPTEDSPVRNVIGANMSMRRHILIGAGGFSESFGWNQDDHHTRVRRPGAKWLHPHVGDEETEFCIRVTKRWPDSVWLYTPRAIVRHRVPAERASWQYFLGRCYKEGIGKAMLARMHGTRAGTEVERAYTCNVLPQGIIRGIGDALVRRDLAGLGRAAAIAGGFAATATGYLVGHGSMGINAVRSTYVQRRPSHSRRDAKALHQFNPVLILEVEVGQQLPVISPVDATTGQRYERALALARLHAQPLGVVEIQLGKDQLPAADVARQIWHALQPEITAHLRQDRLPVPETLEADGLPSTMTPLCVRARTAMLTAAPFVSVVVATHDRPESLATCLRSLLSLNYPRYEILVVDNAPGTDAAAEVVRRLHSAAIQVRYLREDRPGLACAHNRGLQDVQGEIVAFTDDDVVVDRQWLAELVGGFSAAKQVGCVTGLILPMELLTPPQLWIEQYGGFSKGCAERVFDLTTHRRSDPLYPYTAGQFGSGANMAFRTAALRRIGGFDPALGAGSIARGGDDLAAFFQVITAGYTLVYRPAAIVHHPHRRDYAGLRKQMYGYGVGLTAYLTKAVIDQPARIPDLAARMPRGLMYALNARSPKNARKRPDYPRELTMLEWKGMLYGPIAYLRSRRQARKTAIQCASPQVSPAPTTARHEGESAP